LLVTFARIAPPALAADAITASPGMRDQLRAGHLRTHRREVKFARLLRLAVTDGRSCEGEQIVCFVGIAGNRITGLTT
jgi:hypothetical protein